MQELGARISAEEFGEWWAIYRHEPWAEVRADIAAGVIASTVANVNRSGTTRPFGPSDFAPYLKPRTREDAREMNAAQLFEEARRGQ